MRRLIAFSFAMGLAVAGSLGFANPSWADAPATSGWWTATNVSASPVPPPPPPDVDSTSLLIEGGAGSKAGPDNASPTAFAALKYDIPAGAAIKTLTLAVAPNSASVPITTLQLCALKESGFVPEQGGPIADAPKFDCTHSVTAQASGTSFEFKAAALASDDALAVAVLPTQPFDRVVLALPDDKSLALATSSPSPSDSDSLGSTTPTTALPQGGGGSDWGTGGSAGPIDAGGEVLLPAQGGGDPAPVSAGDQAPLTTTPGVPQAQSPGVVTAALPLTDSIAGANRLAVGIALGMVVVGGWAWLAMGRAAVRRCLVE